VKKVQKDQCEKKLKEKRGDEKIINEKKSKRGKRSNQKSIQ
jgi:hypothetical protein